MRAPVPPEAAERLGLVPGQQMRARIIQLDAPEAISVPNVALRSRDGARVVRVRAGSGFDWRKVELGARGVARSQGLAGMSSGDPVLLANAAVPADDGGDDDAGQQETADAEATADKGDETQE